MGFGQVRMKRQGMNNAKTTWSIPIKTGNKWFTTGVFPSPANGAVVTAPGSRNQELKKLTLEITNWALDPKSFPFGK